MTIELLRESQIISSRAKQRKWVAVSDNNILDVSEVTTVFDTESGPVCAVDSLSFSIKRGETLAVVGESGSGKSVTSLSIMQLLGDGGRVESGSIKFDGEELLQKSERQMRQIRGNRIAMIFQEPMTSLNPVYKVGQQIVEAIMLHQHIARGAAWKRAVELLELVGIPEPAARAESYPHELSGGMLQRVMIAMALSCRPELLIADEPTTALDVTIQAQILELIRDLQQEIGMSVLFITHDLGVVAEVADRVVVMYAGRAVEVADVFTLFSSPRMPYTMGLLDSIPQLGRLAEQGGTRLQAIPGNVPSPTDLPPGCAFHPRCQFARDICTRTRPELESVDSAGHLVRCIRWRDIDSNYAPAGRTQA